MGLFELLCVLIGLMLVISLAIIFYHRREIRALRELAFDRPHAVTVTEGGSFIVDRKTAVGAAVHALVERNARLEKQQPARAPTWHEPPIVAENTRLIERQNVLNTEIQDLKAVIDTQTALLKEANEVPKERWSSALRAYRTIPEAPETTFGEVPLSPRMFDPPIPGGIHERAEEFKPAKKPYSTPRIREIKHGQEALDYSDVYDEILAGVMDHGSRKACTGDVHSATARVVAMLQAKGVVLTEHGATATAETMRQHHEAHAARIRTIINETSRRIHGMDFEPSAATLDEIHARALEFIRDSIGPYDRQRYTVPLRDQGHDAACRLQAGRDGLWVIIPNFALNLMAYVQRPQVSEVQLKAVRECWEFLRGAKWPLPAERP